MAAKKITTPLTDEVVKGLRSAATDFKETFTA